MVDGLLHLWLIVITFMVGITFVVDFYHIYDSITFMVVITFMGDTGLTWCYKLKLVCEGK